MRLCSFRGDSGEWRLGAQTDGGIIDLAATDPQIPRSVRELLAAGPSALSQARRAAESSRAARVQNAELGPPIHNPEKVICVGLNYRDHAEEQGAKIPREPVIFNKFVTALAAPGQNIVLPKVSSKVDYEAELVVAVGRGGRHIAASEGMSHVAGYMNGHDVSARDWQAEKDGRQWLLGKSFDGFAPVGPVLVTADEIPDPHDLDIEMRVNGEQLQRSNTREFIFRIEQLIAYVSQVCTLSPGDLIFTGTPSGVGFARTPPRWLQPGDMCEVTVGPLGVLRNRCVAE